MSSCGGCSSSYSAPLQEVPLRQATACSCGRMGRASLMRCAFDGEPGPSVAAGELLYIVAVGYSSAGVFQGSSCACQVLGSR
jgi:hypothetical protein